MAARIYVYNRSDTMRVQVGAQTICFQPDGVEVEVQDPNSYIDDLEAQGIITRIAGGFALNIHLGMSTVVLNGASYAKGSIEMVPNLGTNRLTFLLMGSPIFPNMVPAVVYVDGEFFSNDAEDFVSLFAAYASQGNVGRFLGMHLSAAALEAAHPSALYGDYATVDPGTGENAVQYIWDAQEGWVAGGSAGSGGSGLVPINSQTGSYELVLSDAYPISKIVRIEATADATVTVPLGSSMSTPFPVGAIVGIRNPHPYTVTVEGAEDVTLNGVVPFELLENESLVLHQVAPDEWDVYIGAGGGVSNTAPVAGSVAITGSTIEGQTLSGSYVYSDVDGDLEGSTLRKWYRSDDTSGTNKTLISGATGTTYVLQTADVGKYIQYAVTPKALTGIVTGTQVFSAYTAAIGALGSNAAPVASAVTITGTAQVGQNLTGSYIYSDLESDPEGATIFKWYRADDNSGTNEVLIGGAVTSSYLLSSPDLGKYIRRSVTPVATTGTTTGAEVFSSYVGAVAAAALTGPEVLGVAINSAIAGGTPVTATPRKQLLVTFDEYLAMTFSGDGSSTAWAPTLTTPPSAYTIAGTGGSSGYSGTVIQADIIGPYRTIDSYAPTGQQVYYMKAVLLTLSTALPAGFTGTLSISGSTGLSSKATSDPVMAQSGIAIQDFQVATTGTQTTESYQSNGSNTRITAQTNSLGWLQGGVGVGRYYGLSPAPFVNDGGYGGYDPFLGEIAGVVYHFTYGVQTVQAALSACYLIGELASGLVVVYGTQVDVHTAANASKTLLVYNSSGGGYQAMETNETGTPTPNTQPNAYFWD